MGGERRIKGKDAQDMGVPFGDSIEGGSTRPGLLVREACRVEGRVLWGRREGLSSFQIMVCVGSWYERLV